MTKIAYIALVALVLLPSCTPIGAVMGAGAAVGTAALEERGLDGATKDVQTQIDINQIWFSHDKAMHALVDITVREGNVLLTGIVNTPQQRLDAVRLAWQAEGVKQVINEIEVDAQSDFMERGKDVLAGAELWSKLTFDAEIDSINYAVDVVNGSVYVMGIARNQAELDRVLAHAQTVSYVRRIVDYVRVKEPQAPAQDPQSAGSPY